MNEIATRLEAIGIELCPARAEEIFLSNKAGCGESNRPRFRLAGIVETGPTKWIDGYNLGWEPIFVGSQRAYLKALKGKGPGEQRRDEEWRRKGN